MDIELTKEAIVKNVYHIKRDKKIPLHKHVTAKFEPNIAINIIKTRLYKLFIT